MMRYDRRMRDMVERLEQVFDSVSRSPKYKEAGVAFVRADISRSKLQSLEFDYKLTDAPTFMLFQDGIPYKKEGRKEGVLTSDQLHEFIDAAFANRIDDIIEDKAEARRRAAEESRYYWGAYPYWGAGYYGGYGYPYGYRYGPGFGVGVGFGRRYWW